MKYVIADDTFAVVFNETISHDKVRCGKYITSAGFCEISVGGFSDDPIVKVTAWGESISLGIKSRPDGAEIIKRSIEFRA